MPRKSDRKVPRTYEEAVENLLMQRKTGKVGIFMWPPIAESIESLDGKCPHLIGAEKDVKSARQRKSSIDRGRK